CAAIALNAMTLPRAATIVPLPAARMLGSLTGATLASQDREARPYRGGHAVAGARRRQAVGRRGAVEGRSLAERPAERLGDCGQVPYRPARAGGRARQPADRRLH